MNINILKSKVLKQITSMVLVLVFVTTSIGFFGINAFAKTANVDCQIIKYGTVHATSNTRFTASSTAPVLNIVNDQENSNFSIGFVTFDVSSLKGYTNIESANFSFSTKGVEAEPQGLTFCYTTNNNANSLVTGPNNLESTSIFSGVGNHIANSISYFGLKDFASISSGNISSNKSYSIDFSAAISNAVLNNSNTCTVMILQSRAGGSGSTNGWTDINISFNPTVALTVGVSDGVVDIQDGISELKSAMSNYENKMAAGKIYKNMEAGYTAYVNCQKAYDARVYGSDTSVNLYTYASALNNAVSNMTAWTKPTTNVVPKFDSNETTSTNNATNCLWAESNTDPLAYSMTGSNNTVYNVYYHTGVYMYDGTLPKIPFMIGLYRYSSWGNPNTPQIWYASLYSSVGSLKIQNSLYNGDAAGRNFNDLMNRGYHIYSTANVSGYSILLSSGDVRYMANQFTINPSTTFSGNTTGYVKAYPSSIVYGCGNKQDSYPQKTETQTLGANKPFYIIDVKSLYDKIENSTYINYLKNVSSYKEGGLLDLMRAYDNATSINPTTYSYSSNVENAVSYCGSAIVNAVSKFNAVSTPATDSAYYTQMRNCIGSAKLIGIVNAQIAGDDKTSTRYNENDFNNYLSMLNISNNAMKNVLSSGYATVYNGKSIVVISNDLSESIANLRYNYIVQFYDINNAFLGSKVYSEKDYTDVGLYPNSSMVSGTNNYRNHKSYTWNSVELTRASFADSKVVKITETEKIDPCTLTDYVITVQPSCSTAGTKTSRCVVCESEYSDTISKLEHNYSKTVIAPTCTTQGYDQYVCLDCGDSYTDNYKTAWGHSFVDTVTEPTCNLGGYTSRKCSVCEYEIIDESSITYPLAHVYNCEMVMYADCITGEIFEYTCKKCGYTYTEETEKNPNVHSNLIYARTVEPTQDKLGYDIYYCSYLCGYWEKRNITPPTNIIAEQGNYASYLETYNEAYKYIETDFTSYTRASINEYWAVISGARDMAEAAIESNDPVSIDNATTIILEAKSVLTKI